ncbi:MAG: hypothetical protein ABEJ03_02180 [Candidatus Nanohaloarchaea archaeon]
MLRRDVIRLIGGAGVATLADVSEEKPVENDLDEVWRSLVEYEGRKPDLRRAEFTEFSGGNLNEPTTVGLDWSREVENLYDGGMSPREIIETLTTGGRQEPIRNVSGPYDRTGDLQTPEDPYFARMEAVREGTAVVNLVGLKDIPLSYPAGHDSRVESVSPAGESLPMSEELEVYARYLQDQWTDFFPGKAMDLELSTRVLEPEDLRHGEKDGWEALNELTRESWNEFWVYLVPEESGYLGTLGGFTPELGSLAKYDPASIDGSKSSEDSRRAVTHELAHHVGFIHNPYPGWIEEAPVNSLRSEMIAGGNVEYVYADPNLDTGAAVGAIFHPGEIDEQRSIEEFKNRVEAYVFGDTWMSVGAEYSDDFYIRYAREDGSDVAYILQKGSKDYIRIEPGPNGPEQLETSLQTGQAPG